MKKKISKWINIQKLKEITNTRKYPQKEKKIKTEKNIQL